MLRVDLPQDVSRGLGDAFATLPDLDDTEGYLAHLLRAAALLPVEVLRAFLRFRSSPSAPSAMLVTGLPVDADLPPTPTGGAPGAAKPHGVSEASILTVAVLLGEPVAYRAEKDGALVQNVYPTPARRDVPSNESSSAPLGFHTELTFSRARPDRPLHAASPDFVLLLALRCPADRRASTAVVDDRDVCARLDPHHVATLREPSFQLQAPYSFTRDGDGSRPWSPPVALLRGPEDAPSLAFDTACGVRGLSDAATAAIEALTAVCDDPDVHETVQLGAGDLLAIDNTRAAHARGSFPAVFDGRDRWLQRAYVRRSIWPLPTEAASSRVLV